MLSKELHPVVQKVMAEGYQITPDAFALLGERPIEEAITLMEGALRRARGQSNIFIIDAQFLIKEPEVKRPMKPILANKSLNRLEFIMSEETHSIGTSNGYIDYFNSRFKQLETIIKQRLDLKDAIPLSKAMKLPMKTKFKAIGIVTEKSARNNRLFLDLEDQDTTIQVMVSGEDNIKKGLEILPDQVICFAGTRFREKMMVANELYWPDIPMHNIHRSNDPVSVVFVGDVHVGSTHFREDLFEKFIRWLNQDLGPQPSKDLAATVKYVVIAGDLVDEIGIYPNQLDELTIPTQKAQYEEAGKLIARFPDHIETIIIPGNHDAVRRSLPQPVIPESYAPTLHANPNVFMAPNPVYVDLNTVRVLIAHGTALTDILGSTPGHDFHNPVNAIELLLKCRHIAPSYGGATPIAPEKVDRLVMKHIPDVIVMGHIHIYESTKYKGVTLIAAGSFQDQTPFQKRMKLVPTPGVLSVFNLKTHDQYPLDLERLN
jgi:DNA polymerase II small subunit